MRRLLNRPSTLGAILAVLVAALVYVYMGSASAAGEPEPIEIERVPVLVARSLIEQRSAFDASQVEVRLLPAEAVHPTALGRIGQISGKFAAADLVPGEQILASDIADRPQGGGLAQLIPEGYRALSIAVSDAIAAGGLVAPGDHVDVVAVFDAAKAGWDGATTVVQDVEVLAVSKLLLGAEDEPDEGSGRSSPTSLSATVTLAVSPYGARLIALADEFGALSIVLRRADDDGSAYIAPINLDQLLGR